MTTTVSQRIGEVVGTKPLLAWLEGAPTPAWRRVGWVRTGSEGVRARFDGESVVVRPAWEARDSRPANATVLAVVKFGVFVAGEGMVEIARAGITRAVHERSIAEGAALVRAGYERAKPRRHVFLWRAGDVLPGPAHGEVRCAEAKAVARSERRCAHQLSVDKDPRGTGEVANMDAVRTDRDLGVAPRDGVVGDHDRAVLGAPKRVRSRRQSQLGALALGL